MSREKPAEKGLLLNAINGYEKADAEVMLNGSNMYTQYKKMQYKMGFVLQSEMMRGRYTVLNTLLDAAKLQLPKDVSKKQRQERVDEVMNIFGLQPVKKDMVESRGISMNPVKNLIVHKKHTKNRNIY